MYIKMSQHIERKKCANFYRKDALAILRQRYEFYNQIETVQQAKKLLHAIETTSGLLISFCGTAKFIIPFLCILCVYLFMVSLSF